ncbi:hypothetical protein [Legionella rowbothamii]|uniref:hypothetical protein n=1 Tax=Legionella rowbothamii TaxID=96229 RepID=UPI001054BBE0|nr:hypothetical protein [Legionella rowbothamii]
MPQITDFSQFLETEVIRTNTGYQYQLGLPIIPQVQHGQVCKLNALSVVLNSLNKFRGMPVPLPIRKNDGEYSYSLRQLAKEKYGSQVGEIYSAKTLAAIAADNGYYKSTIYTEEQFDNYVDRIISAINASEAPIIFFDVNNEGDPTYLASNREHAVVVAGYFTSNESQLCFIVSQWGKYHWIKAEDVFVSTSQLSSSRPPETFFKYEAGWFDLYSKRFFPPNAFEKPPSDRRKAHELPMEDGGLKNKIFIVHQQPQTTNQLSFWSSPTYLTTKESELLFRQDLIRKNIVHTSL